MPRVLGGMIPSPPWPVREVCARYAHTNMGDLDSYPEIEAYEADAIARLSRVSLGRSYPGKMTSGATESNILAALYWRSRGKTRIVAPPTAHYSVWKAADLLGMSRRVIRSPQDVGPRDLVVLTIGTTEIGGVDDIDAFVAAARRVGAAVHVDAAYAGPVARYLDPSLGVELDGTVATYAVDFHKIPEAPPPAGALIAYSEEVIESLWFKAPYLPSRRQFGLYGTRPGCSAPAALEAVKLVVEGWRGGPAGLARDLDRLVEEIALEAGEHGYRVEGGPMPVRCLHPPNPGVPARLSALGVRYYTCGKGGVRIVAMPHLLWEGYGWIAEVLEEAARG